MGHHLQVSIKHGGGGGWWLGGRCSKTIILAHASASLLAADEQKSRATEYDDFSERARSLAKRVPSWIYPVYIYIYIFHIKLITFSYKSKPPDFTNEKEIDWLKSSKTTFPKCYMGNHIFILSYKTIKKHNIYHWRQWGYFKWCFLQLFLYVLG